MTPADPPLLATKLFVPPPRPNRITRARLRDRLDGARGGTVTLAAAAAGSGKSTLLAEWALSAARPVAWLSLDAADDEPSRFIGYVIAALKNAGTVASMDAFAHPGPAVPGAVEAVVTELLNAVAGEGADVALVLDDYHVIESERVHGVVQRMIDRIPPNLHLVIATRVDPPLALSRLRARGLLTELRAADLCFTADEAARFLNEGMELGLGTDEIAELERCTEGWAVGLQMAAISLRGRRDAREFISSFSGSNRYVLDYLTDEVLHRQPPEMRSFLLDTSILGRLNAPLCDAVTGRPDSEGVLRQLELANLFLIPLDDVRFWYRYHHLFASLLQHELERTMSAGHIAELHRRASAWYESSGMPEPALHHAVEARDDERAVSIVSTHACTRIASGDGGTIVRWISRLPRARVENDVDLLILHARSLMTQYDVRTAIREVARAEEIVPEADRERYQGAILSLRGMLEGLAGDAVRSVEALERAMSLLQPDDFWYSMTSAHLGIVALMVPDLQGAVRHFGRATGARHRADGLLTAAFSQCYGGWARLSRGEPDEAALMAQEANAWIERREGEHDDGMPLGSLSYGLLSDTHRMWNELDRARAYAQRALECGKKGLLVGYTEAARVLALVAEAQGDWGTATTAAREAARGLRVASTIELAEAAEALEYQVLWRRGMRGGGHDDLDRVAQWCEASGLLDVATWRLRMRPGLGPDFGLMIGARVLLHREQYEDAQRLLEALLDEAVRSERVPAQVSLLVLRSLAESGLGRPDAAVGSMARALETAGKPRFVRPFLDEGSAALPILERAAARAPDRGFASRVLSAFAVPVTRRTAPPGSTEALSNRELEVLQLVAAGASNQAAAGKLFVAPSTVKKHLENIYAKLGVGGRTQAVARARELQIL